MSEKLGSEARAHSSSSKPRDGCGVRRPRREGEFRIRADDGEGVGGWPIEEADPHELKPGLTIQIPPPPVFFATKFEAFRGRGGGELYASHDFEDIVTLVAGRPELVAEVSGHASNDRRDYLSVRAGEALEDRSLESGVSGQLPEASKLPGLVERVIDRLEAVAKGDLTAS